MDIAETHLLGEKQNDWKKKKTQRVIMSEVDEMILYLIW